MSNQNKLGLSLSGGGYRASAFHLGTLKKLYSMNVLDKVEVISTISGGSITGAAYALNKEDFEHFYQEFYSALQKKDVIRNILFSWMGLRFLLFILIFLGSFYFLFTTKAWIFPIIIVLLALILFKFQFNVLPVSKRIEQVYDDFFFRKKTLKELPDKPLLVIGSTNLQTARTFTFSKNVMRDTSYQFLDKPVEFKPAEFPVARAVMASSCVPFAFTPIKIDKQFFEEPEQSKYVHPALVDGGVYDNQGIHAVMQAGRYACDVVITSDAGCGEKGEKTFSNTFTLLLETVNTFMSRIRKSQMVANVYENANTANKQVAYFSLGWDVEKCIPGFIDNLVKKQITKSVIAAHELLPEWIAEPKKYTLEIAEHLKRRLNYNSIAKPTIEEKRIARSVGTNLTRLKKEHVDALIKQAEALTEVQVKLYCPSILT